MKKIRQTLPAALLILFAILFIPGMANAATKEYQGERWNFKKTVKKTSGAFTYYAYPSKNQKEAWIYKIKIKAGKNCGTLSIPSKLAGKTVTRLGRKRINEWNDYSNALCNIFDVWVRPWDEDVFPCDDPKVDLIKKIAIPNTVKIIQPVAFAGMNSVTAVKLPKSVKTLGEFTFYHCDRLKKAELSAGLSSLDPLAFWKCPKLAKITVPSKNKTYQVKDNFVITKKKKKLVLALPLEKKIQVPEGVKALTKYAFSNCDAEEVHVSASVLEMEAGAFLEPYPSWRNANARIEDVTVDEENEVYERDGQCIYNKTDRSLVIMIADKTGVVYVSDEVRRLTENVSTVGEGAKDGLSKLVFPKQLWYIVDQGLNAVFAEKVYFTGGKPPKVILKKRKKAYGPDYHIYVPESSEESYRAWYKRLKKPGWTEERSFNTFKPEDEI